MIKDIIKWKLNFKKKLPNCFIFFVTSKCNSKCKHCFNWKNLTNKKDLNLNEIEKISKNLDKILWLHLSGGEPFMREDLSKICSIFIKNNKTKNFSIPTNCLLGNKIINQIKKILDENPKINLNILLSLDGLSKTHDYIRGVKGNFKKVIYLEKELSRLKRKYSNLSVMVCTTVNNQNDKEIIPLLNFVKEKMNADFHSIELIRGNPRDKTFKLPSLNTLEKIYKEYEKNCKHYYEKRDKRYYTKNYLMQKIYKKIARRINQFLFESQLRIIKEKKQVIPCSAGQTAAVIGEAGEVYLCELLPKIGELRKSNYNFKKIWYSKKAKEQRKFIKGKKCHCTHCIFLTRSILFNPLLLIKALCKR